MAEIITIICGRLLACFFAMLSRTVFCLKDLVTRAGGAIDRASDRASERASARAGDGGRPPGRRLPTANLEPKRPRASFSRGHTNPITRTTPIRLRPASYGLPGTRYYYLVLWCQTVEYCAKRVKWYLHYGVTKRSP